MALFLCRHPPARPSRPLPPSWGGLYLGLCGRECGCRCIDASLTFHIICSTLLAPAHLRQLVLVLSKVGAHAPYPQLAAGPGVVDLRADLRTVARNIAVAIFSAHLGTSTASTNSPSSAAIDGLCGGTARDASREMRIIVFTCANRPRSYRCRAACPYLRVFNRGMVAALPPASPSLAAELLATLRALHGYPLAVPLDALQLAAWAQSAQRRATVLLEPEAPAPTPWQPPRWEPPSADFVAWPQRALFEESFGAALWMDTLSAAKHATHDPDAFTVGPSSYPMLNRLYLNRFTAIAICAPAAVYDNRVRLRMPRWLCERVHHTFHVTRG